MSKSPAKQALEILERAGYKAPRYLADAEHPLELIVADLQHYVEQEEAELEAEALFFFNAFWEGRDSLPIDSWDKEPGNAKQSWLAVARKAREIAKEATK